MATRSRKYRRNHYRNIRPWAVHNAAHGFRPESSRTDLLSAVDWPHERNPNFFGSGRSDNIEKTRMAHEFRSLPRRTSRNLGCSLRSLTPPFFQRQTTRWPFNQLIPLSLKEAREGDCNLSQPHVRQSTTLNSTRRSSASLRSSVPIPIRFSFDPAPLAMVRVRNADSF